MKLYVAVVCRKEDPVNGSKWPDKHWAAFVDASLDSAIDKALKACRKWEREQMGEYDVLAGALHSEVKPLADYALLRLKKPTGGK